MKQSIKSKLKRACMYLLGFSATPILTACYGVPTPYDEPHLPFDDISGTIVDAKSRKPIAGIKVSIRNDQNISTISDSNGKFYIDHFFEDSCIVDCEDIDGKENGEYQKSFGRRVNAENNLDVTIAMYEKW